MSNQAYETLKQIKCASTRFCSFKAAHIQSLPEWMNWRIRQNMAGREADYQMILCALKEGGEE